jgi:hypothetical protein
MTVHWPNGKPLLGDDTDASRFARNVASEDGHRHQFTNGDRVTAPTLDPVHESALYIGPYPSHPDFYSWVQVGGVARVMVTADLSLAPETVEVTVMLTEDEAQARSASTRPALPGSPWYTGEVKFIDACRKALSDD